MKVNMLKTLLFASLGIIMVFAFTSAKEPYSPPDAPGIPLVIEMHKDKCTIRYSAPRRDGGNLRRSKAGAVKLELLLLQVKYINYSYY